MDLQLSCYHIRLNGYFCDVLTHQLRDNTIDSLVAFFSYGFVVDQRLVDQRLYFRVELLTRVRTDLANFLFLDTIRHVSNDVEYLNYWDVQAILLKPWVEEFIETLFINAFLREPFENLIEVELIIFDLSGRHFYESGVAIQLLKQWMAHECLSNFNPIVFSKMIYSLSFFVNEVHNVLILKF